MTRARPRLRRSRWTAPDLSRSSAPGPAPAPFVGHPARSTDSTQPIPLALAPQLPQLPQLLRIPLAPRIPLVIALALACSPPAEPVQRAPRVLRFSPAHPELSLRLDHPGGADPVALTRIRIDPTGPDWGAFTITDATLPRHLTPGEPAELHLRVDLDHFAADPHSHRPGAAALTLLADKRPVRVPLEFSPDPGDPHSPPDPAIWPRRGLLVALAALAFARRWPWRTAVPALVCLAVAPFAPPLCLDLLADPATTADLLQCAAGRGGFAGQLLVHPDGLGLALAAICLSGLPAAGPPASAPAWRALALALFAALVAAGSLDPQIAVHTQAGLRWGLWMQPLGAAALTVAALVLVRSGPPLPRLVALGLAALLTTLLLGGPDLGLASPGLPGLATAAAGLCAWLGKLLLVAWALRRAAEARGFRPWLARLVVPLAAAQLLATVLPAWAASAASAASTPSWP